jgi:hypothetical protein
MLPPQTNFPISTTEYTLNKKAVTNTYAYDALQMTGNREESHLKNQS